MEKTKIIKDLVHGYIEIDIRVENLINTLHFQRLKDICQLTAQQAYPCANHTRFEHSLGVMHLATLAFNSLYENSQEFICQKPYFITDSNFKSLSDHLIIASLLHDVGHAPFSHLGEKYYRKAEILFEIKNININNNLNIDMSIFLNGSNHELMSCYIILKNYYDLIINNFSPNINFELICRCIVGSKYATLEKSAENLIITILNSSTIDVDKLDYLVRDAFMTGVNVPNIDLIRLFKNIHINQHEITFKKNALPVIQNIIDARDSLYLWVYNHHTAVYSDFIIEFYIKHQISNYENSKFTDRLDPQCYFSCEAISKNLISNSDLTAKLKEPYSNKQSSEEKGKISNYTQTLISQIFERKFLKPLWKTLHQYNQFLKENISDDRLKEELIKSMCNEDHSYRAYFVKQMMKKTNLSHGEIFIVPRSNKFYSLNTQSSFFVFIDDHDINIKQLLPQKDFGDMYQNVSFYIFTKQDKIEEVKQAFIETALEGLPAKDDLQADITTLNWFASGPSSTSTGK